MWIDGGKKKNEITNKNAGNHNPLLIKTDKTIKRPNVGGLIVRIMPSVPYEEEIIQFDKGDLLVIFSDGITEAMNAEEEEFEEERLLELLLKNKSKNPEVLIDLIINEVNNFAAGQPQMDDMTIIVIKRD